MPTKTTKEETPKEQPKAKTGKYFYANGKRKTSVARVKLFKGKGEITINDQSLSDFCDVKTLIGLVKAPLKLVGGLNEFDVEAKVTGGGKNSQAEAVRHGISKALVEADPLNKPVLKKAGYITRDPRSKERKKFGLKRARRAPQFSKR